jgi:tRNA nucleotidyltransferase (CCA-adding enzyme)
MIIPREVKKILTGLKKAGFEAYIVGGCVRDFLLGVEPKDWDITTNAKPEEIQKVFPNSFYENNFLTVTIKTGSKKMELGQVEVTTFRFEAKYSDKRHPDQIKYAKTLQEDLSRRDFTINAIAIALIGEKKEIIDPFEGQKDLKEKIIKTVGGVDERFSEDALRMLRAVRLATVLGFEIEKKTGEAIHKNSALLKHISQERIRDELVKIIMADNAGEGIESLRQAGLLKLIVPELLENYGVGQNKHHIYDCYTHALKALEYSAKKKYNLQVRLAALFHDIAKPRVKRVSGKEATFYNHEVVGEKMARQILFRLKFSGKDIEKITKLIKYHMFYYNVGEVSESSVRRLVKNMGPENMEELLQLREADRIGSGVPKAEPYKLRHLKYIIEKVSKDPISVKMLKLNGKDVMNTLGINPGPKVGQILGILLSYVLDDPKKNAKKLLEKEVLVLGKLPVKELVNLSEKSKEEKTEEQKKQDEEVKQKYWVK